MKAKRPPGLASRIKLWALSQASRVARRKSKFELDGHSYGYLSHPYNESYGTERTVEVPVVRRYLNAAESRRVLEVGNVLSHYGLRGHDVIDKFEVGPGVRNLDVVDLPLEPKYDLIATISTIEHIGFDEDPSRRKEQATMGFRTTPDGVFDPDKPLRAIQHMLDLLAPGGILVATFPVGFNPHLDEMVAAGQLPFETLGYLRRCDAANRWQQCSLEDVRGVQYGAPYRCANAVVIATASR